MNRAHLQTLSDARMREAKILFAAGEYSGAYYLSGYAVECALKACFAKAVRRYDFPDKTRAGKIFTHRLPDLVRLANLDSDLASAARPGSKLAGSWLLVCNWTEDSRYSNWTKDQAEQMIEAIAGKGNGVLPWIKQRW